MAQFINYYDVDLWKPSNPMPLRQMACEGDARGLRVGAVVTSNGETVSLGGSCVGKVVRADGATVTLTGVINGNIAYVVLDQASCSIEGPIQVAVCWVSGSDVTTLVVAYGTVVNTQTGVAIQPSTPIPDLAQLLAAISDMQTATAAANAAASGALGNFAPAFAEATANAAGSYVTYTDGKLYYLPSGHTANVTWANTTKTAVTVGAELSDLKSALAFLTDNTFYTYTKDKSISRTSMPTQATEVDWESAVVECSEGDVFYVKGYGGNNTRLWMFAQSNGTLITESIAGLHSSDLIKIVAPADASYLCVNSQYTQIRGELIGKPVLRDVVADVSRDTNSAISAIDEIVKKAPSYLDGSEFVSGYANSSGTISESSQCQYSEIDIGSDLVYKTIYISGSAWFSVLPYVFKGQSGAIVTPSVSGTSTPVQYSGLELVPNETGTLYVNKYDSNNVHHDANAYILEIASIKAEMIPQPMPVKDVREYAPVVLSMIQYKLLSGTTGAISDSDSATYYVSDYTEVVPNSRVMITTEHFWGQGMWAFYDSNRNFISDSGRCANSGGTPTKVYCEIVDVPSNAQYIVIGFLYQGNFTECYLWQGAISNGLGSKKWAGIKWTMLGDSLTEHNDKAAMHYYDYIRGATGIEIVNLAVSGTGYAKGGASNFVAQANSVPADSDVITIFGSFNDLSSGVSLGTATDTGTSTIAGCINTTITNIQSIIPLAQIGIIAPTPWNTTPPSTSGTAYDYVEMLKAICERRSIPFLDLWRCSNLRPWDSNFLQYAYSNDGGGGVHPDSAGHGLIAPRFEAFLDSLLLH